MDWTDTIKTLAPTVVSALGGPLAGAALSAVGSIFGISTATTEKIAAKIQQGSLNPEQLADLKKLELEYVKNEAEMGFKYSELEFRDRDSARNANVSGGIQSYLLALSVVLLALTLGSEIVVMFYGIPDNVQDIVVGRILGQLDSVTILVLSYWYGTSHSSKLKTDMLIKAQ